MKNIKHEVNSIYVSLDGPIRKILEREGLQLYALNKLTRSDLRKAIHQLQPDIIHAHDFTAGITAVISTRSIPIINHLHHNAPWKRKYGLYSFLYALACMRIGKILAVSKSVVKEYVFGKFITHKSLVVGNPVDFKLIRNKAESAIENDYSDIIFIGRLSEAKNPLLFLDIIAKIVKFIPNLKVAIAGDGNLREAVETSIETKGLSDIVKMYGFLENPYGLLANSRLLCMTSTWEGFGLVAVEALSLGKPVIASQVGGLTEIVDETCGALCNNKDEYVENILRILSSDSLYKEKAEEAIRKSKKFDKLKDYMSIISQAYC